MIAATSEQLFSSLREAVTRAGSALRCTTHLQPAGGPGDKIFPPTYKDDRNHTVYATEERLLDGALIPCVLLDSVQSQANRLEQALLTAIETEALAFPLLATEVEGYGRVTVLEAPHRVYDAILRDSTLDGVPFRQSILGQQLLSARPHRATALYQYCPQVLLLGGWDSHGGEGGRGARIARALTSEIIGVQTTPGVRPASRHDPLGITLSAGPIYRAPAPEQWTLDLDTATQDKGKAQRYGDGNPSSIGHSHIPSSLELGGVTLRDARQITVLSLAALRRLRFPDLATGTALLARDQAGRVVLAALAMYLLALQVAQGFDLRSRCVLVPTTPPQAEIVGPIATQCQAFALDVASAHDVLQQALRHADMMGLHWETVPVLLQAQAKLNTLVRRSQTTEAGAVEGEQT
jgi:CRISPR-associated protein Csb1